MMTPLLRKLVHDVPALTDQTIVPLRVSLLADLNSIFEDGFHLDVNSMV